MQKESPSLNSVVFLNIYLLRQIIISFWYPCLALNVSLASNKEADSERKKEIKTLYGADAV